MMFAIGAFVGLMIGGFFGVFVTAMLTAARFSDLQDKIDALETSRMSQ